MHYNGICDRINAMDLATESGLWNSQRTNYNRIRNGILLRNRRQNTIYKIFHSIVAFAMEL